MANEIAVDKCQPGVLCLVQTLIKVKKKFGKPEDQGNSAAINRALIYATDDVVLTSDDYRHIADIIDANRAKRAKQKGL